MMILANVMIVDENFDIKKCDLRIQGESIAEVGENLIGDEVMWRRERIG